MTWFEDTGSNLQKMGSQRRLLSYLMLKDMSPEILHEYVMTGVDPKGKLKRREDEDREE